MTNGEKLKEIFPDTKIITQYDNPFGDRFMVFTLNNEDMQVNIDWWNAEYKEPITKNCIACKYDETEEEDGEHCKKCLKGDSQFELDNEFVESTIKNDCAEQNGCITCSLDDGDDCCRKLYEESMKNNLDVDCIDRNSIKYYPGQGGYMYASKGEIDKLPSVIPSSSVLDKKLKKDFGESDCISRADVLQILLDYDYANENALVLKDIKALPSVTPQEPRWISVSEKLPAPFTFVNATCRSLVDDRENWVVETIYLPIPKETNKHGYSDWGNIPMLNWGEAEVIAWVERIIPQPYKAESEK